eukprot:TRINITY_DN49906_c0_g1_i1.p2 TRINITY_DN49906_c0_g1~~TRINITY_DN49906_c0_g1_i1.p2  ORF type:complete len:156 (-),score=28.34 TRINITY_DN49906_c0_g1_i1:107-574(-)
MAEQFESSASVDPVAAAASSSAHSGGNSSARRRRHLFNDAPPEVLQSRRHGAATAASPAAMHRIPAPGPGAYDVGKRDVAHTKETNARVLFGRQERFKHAPPFLPGHADRAQIGPGHYSAEQTICLGKYRTGSMQSSPRWPIPRRRPLEFAKTSC